MQGSWNPLGAQSSFGSGFGGGGFGSDSMWGTGFGGGGGGGQMASYPPHNAGPRGPGGQQQQGQRRNKIKQRGREGGGGQAVASRRPISTHVSKPIDHGLESARYAKIRLKLAGARPWGSSHKAVIDPKKQHKKRPAKEEEMDQRPQAKRGRSDRKVPVEEEEELLQAGTSYKHAKDRPAELENNRFEPGQLVEIQQGSDANEWKLAVVHAFKESGGYTIQLEPVENNRHKQTGVTFNQLRMACLHPDCRRHAVCPSPHANLHRRIPHDSLAGRSPTPKCVHQSTRIRDPDLRFTRPWICGSPAAPLTLNPPRRQLFLAALPLFCDRCKNSLMQSAQRRVYFQEKMDAAELANATSCIRLCNTCYTSLKNEFKSKGASGNCACGLAVRSRMACP